MFEVLINSKNQIIKERDELLNKLDSNYILYINEVLQQKLLIRQTIQHQYDQQIKNIDKLLFKSSNNTKNVSNLNKIRSPSPQSNEIQNNNASISNGDFHCIYCSNSFTSYKLLRNHLHSHTDKPCLCQHCPNAFRNTSDLNQHLPQHQHAQNRPYSCNLCLKLFDCHTSFPQPFTLTTHKWRVHKI
eukprot:UN11331